jgi:hypothetical protein
MTVNPFHQFFLDDAIHRCKICLPFYQWQKKWSYCLIWLMRWRRLIDLSGRRVTFVGTIPDHRLPMEKIRLLSHLADLMCRLMDVVQLKARIASWLGQVFTVSKID